MPKFVYDFAEGNRDLKDLLGGKGANLAEMTNLGLPVPPGFTITTEACTHWLLHDEEPAGLEHEIAEHLARIEASPGTTDELTRLLHARLRAVLEAWVWRTQHVDLRRNAGWARSLLPPDLADFYTADPDPQALRSDRLDHLLTRIENL